MKIDEITNSDKLDEVPAGGLTQFARKAGSKILNKLPGATAKSKAGNLAGKADLGDTANNLHKEFNNIIRDIASKQNILLIDLDEKINPKMPIFTDIVHFNEAGNNVMANIIHDFFITELQN